MIPTVIYQYQPRFETGIFWVQVRCISATSSITRTIYRRIFVWIVNEMAMAWSRYWPIICLEGLTKTMKTSGVSLTLPKIEQNICRVEVQRAICAISFILFEFVLHYIWRQICGPVFRERKSIRCCVCIPGCLFVLSPLFILYGNFLLTQLYTSYGQFFRVYVRCYFIPMEWMIHIVLKSW